MKTHTLFFAAIVYALITAPAMAMQESGSSGTMGGHDMKSGQKMDQGTHGMQMDHSGMGGNFKYTATEEGINAEFQVMSLASMNMTSDKRETHHIMVNLKAAEGGAPIKNAIGKIKVIGPEKSEQEGTLKNYNGILAANFTFKEPGKYGVICLLKNGDKKPVFKFWYHHMQ